MLRKGFTLIELLIVITIIAILAGAAIPYVQDYVEDARIAKARADLAELRNAIVRFETERGKTFEPTDEGYTLATFQGALVGPYLQSALTDPWGSPYYLATEASLVYSAAQDASKTTNIIALDFRPATACTRAYWIDVNKNGLVDGGDDIDMKFTRPLADVAATELLTNYTTTFPGASFGTTSIEHPHPIRGLSWVRLNLAADVAGLQSGIEIKVSPNVTDDSDAAADIGTNLTDVPCASTPVILISAQ